MPKLLRKKLGKWMADMTAIVIFALCGWIAVDKLIGTVQNQSGFFRLDGVMCIFFVCCLYGNSLSSMEEYFYIAPYSYEQRKAIFRKYFRWQFLLTCIFVVAWNIFFYYYALDAGISIHPEKALFGLMLQFCLLYETLFLNYFRPTIFFMILAVASVWIDGGIMTLILKEPVMTLADGILMTVLGVICFVPALVLWVEYFGQMLDCHSRYETSRKVPGGFMG